MVRRILCGVMVAASVAALAAEPSYETLICHRGESVDAPENTLPAYRMAVDRGFGFECDIYMTKDGRCFTFHDKDLARTTGGANTNRCADVTWDVVSKLDVGNWGPWKGSPYAGTPPALLEDVLALARDGRWIYVEIKPGPEIVPHVKEVLSKQTNATERNILFISFDARTCAALKRELPAYKVYLLTGATYWTPDRGWPAFTAEDIIRQVKACHADGIDIYFDPNVHTAEFIAEVKKAGLSFHAWTVDDPLKMRLAFARGADTLTTNCAKRQLETYRAKSPLGTWKLPSGVTREGSRLIVDVPEGKPGVGATAPVDLSRFPEGFEGRIRCSGKNVTNPPESWLGLKFMIRYKDAAGRDWWPQAAKVSGTFDGVWLRFAHRYPAGLKDGWGELTLGLQSASGRVVFDLDTLEVRSVRKFKPGDVSRADVNYICHYTGDCRSGLRRCGVMLPERPMTEDDFKTLNKWGVTLVRYQMVRNWMKENDNRDLAEYNAWLDSKIEHLDGTVLPLSEKYGIRVVVDLHVTPGGKAGGELNMFYEDKYAVAFLDCWKKIARRFKGRRGIYGYDLVNEPCQTFRTRADGDWWNLQRRAAEAVREIDPDIPIIIESNEWDSPSSFSYMRPLRMTNVIYQVHLYHPGEFTHQGLSPNRPAGTVWPDASKGWNRELLVRTLEPVRAFEKAHGAKIYVGEFSAIAWAKGADRYLRDCISIFEEYGWDWTYHAFREYDGWSVECESAVPGVCQPSADNPRKRALLDGLSAAKVRVGRK